MNIFFSHFSHGVSLIIFQCLWLTFCSYLLGQCQLGHPECQPADSVTPGSGTSTHPDSQGQNQYFYYCSNSNTSWRCFFFSCLHFFFWHQNCWFRYTDTYNLFKIWLGVSKSESSLKLHLHTRGMEQDWDCYVAILWTPVQLHSIISPRKAEANRLWCLRHRILMNHFLGVVFWLWLQPLCDVFLLFFKQSI